jgi:hypothetical protein
VTESVWVLLTDSVLWVMEAWKSRFGLKFLGSFKEKGYKLSEPNGVPVDHRGRPSILLHKSIDGWTKDVCDLWEQVEDDSSGLVPVIGVSGSGKTRFLYELLAEKWGFFFTAKTKGNGGSDDVDSLASHRIVSDTDANHMNAMGLMRCVILSRLLILEFFLKEIPELLPLQWLLLQVQFRAFPCGDAEKDPFFALYRELSVLEDFDGVNTMIGELWASLQGKLGCTFTAVLDEAQVLGNINAGKYKSPETSALRSIFSPLVKALVVPYFLCKRQKVFVAGIGVSFLTLESDIGSVLAKVKAGGPARFYSAPFSEWKDVRQVQEFCSSYLKLDVGLEKENAHYLLQKFRGRRRCLVSCVERLLKESGGVWSKKIVDDYFEEITSSTMDTTSIYYAVETLCGAKGAVMLNGENFNASSLVRRLGTFIAYAGRVEFMVTTEGDMTLLERGLGQLQPSRAVSKYTFTLYEPTVHRNILNYLEDNDLFEKSLKDQMVDMSFDASAMGRLWESLFTLHVAKLFDSTKFLAKMCCFQRCILPPGFKNDKPKITGEGKTVWRESYERQTVGGFLDAEEESRPPFLIFDDRSGLDVLFVVKLGNLRIPVFCQLKLRSRVTWATAVVTTNPDCMYKQYPEFRKRVTDACKGGYISLVVGFLAKKSDKLKSGWKDNRLVGYIGKEEAESLFGRDLCDFLSSLKK